MLVALAGMTWLAGDAAPSGWNQQARVVSDATASFTPGGTSGQGLAILGDLLVVGEAHDQSGTPHPGRARVYRWNGSVWAQEQVLMASDGADGDYFGWAVATNGTQIAVSAPYDGTNPSYTGSVYLFSRSGGTWVQDLKLTAPEPVQLYDRLGWSLDMDASRLVVGMRYDDDKGFDSGSAYVYVRDAGGTWSLEDKVVAADGSGAGYFGTSVGLNGDRIVVGAPGDAAAYVFARSGSVWSQEAKLTPTIGSTLDFFGESVSISGLRACVGAPHHAGAGTYSGAVYVFEHTGSGWAETARLLAADAAAQDQLGGAVALSGTRLFAGAIHDEEAGPHTGAAYVFTLAGGGWSQAQKLTAADAGTGDYFGVTVVTDGTSLAVNAVGWDSPTVADLGAVYVFQQAAPPTITCPAPQTVEADVPGNPGTRTVTLTFGVDDPGGEAREVVVTVDGSQQAAFTLATGVDSFDFTHAYALPSGTVHTVTVTATGAVTGLSDSCSTTVTVLDTTAPSTHVSTDTSSLWPANHKFVDVQLAFSATDGGDLAPTAEVLVYANEAPGSGPHGIDALYEDGELELRAERDEPGDGRIYLVVVASTDAAGNRGVAVAGVVVPPNQSAAARSALQAAAAADVATTQAAGGTPPAGYVRLTPAP